MNRRRALGRSLALVLASAGWAGIDLSAAEPDDDGRAVVHRPDVQRIKAPRQGAAKVDLRPDGKRLVAVSRRDSDTVQIWDIEACRELRAFGDGKGTDGFAAYSRDGTRIVTFGTDGWILEPRGNKIHRTPAGYAIKVWDAETGRETASFPSKSGVLGAALGSDGTTITTVDSENRLQVREIDGGREIANIMGNFPEANRHIGEYRVHKSVAFDAKARRVVLATTDILQNVKGRETYEAVLTLWDVDKYEVRNVDLKQKLELERVAGSCLLSPDGTRIVIIYTGCSCGGPVALGFDKCNRKAVIVDSATLAVVSRTVPEMDPQEQLLAFSPDGKWFVTWRGDGSLRIWDVATGRIVWTIKGPRPFDVPGSNVRWIAAKAISFLPRGIRVVSGGMHGWNEVDPITNRIKVDQVTGEVLVVEPLQIWDAEFDWVP
jgi:WD40 repeat protein